MGTVTTVLGEVDAKTLGFCHCHEHLLIADGASRRQNDALFMEDVDKSAAETADFAAAGGGAIVDAQPGGCGRMSDGLAEISRRTGVHVIASTGFHKMIYYAALDAIHTADEAQLTAYFLQELQTGMCDSGVGHCAGRPGPQAGIIKTALDTEGLSRRYKRLFAAAAAAAAQSGAPLMVHIERGSDPLALLDFLAARGIPSSRVMLCHLDRAVDDLAIHKEACARGAYLDYDTIGRFKYHSDEREAEIVEEMLAGGHGDRLLFSLDTTRLRLLRYGGQPGLGYILKTFVPLLLARGVTRAQCDVMTCQNPQVILSMATAHA